MKKRMIGSLEVSIAGLGCNNFGRVIDAAKTAEVVAAALDEGVTLFDTADLYGDGLSEEYLGRALRGRRGDAVIATKFGMMAPPDGLKPGSAEWTARACENSLRRLGTDRIDLYILHQPDPATPIAETLQALGALVSSGKVREIGCSNFTVPQVAEASKAAAAHGMKGFASVQNECSLVHADDLEDMIPDCVSREIAYVPFFPLASGVLTGKYRRGVDPPEGTRLARAAPDRRSRYANDRNFDLAERLERFAGDRGHTLHELALSWLASLPAVAAVIPGATSAAQARQNARATAAWALSPEEMAEVKALLAGPA
jgi:aryl-alcohol dehydrogenase-like predicted oxidoreductase